MASLPESDAVAQVKVKQLLSEAMPRILANNPAKLSEVNASIDKFKDRTGLDPRMFQQVALGIRFTYPVGRRDESCKLSHWQTEPLARRRWLRPVESLRTESIAKKSITTRRSTFSRSKKTSSCSVSSISESANSPRRHSTPTRWRSEIRQAVRGAIDASRSRKRANAELIALASRDPNAIIGFGSNMTEQLVGNLDIGNAPIAADLKTLRQVYGSVGTTARDLQLFLGARAVNAEAREEPRRHAGRIEAIRRVVRGTFVGSKGVLAKSALSNLKIVADANELQIRTSVAQAEVGPLLGN